MSQMTRIFTGKTRGGPVYREPNTFTIEEVSAFLDVSDEHVRQEVKAGHIATVRTTRPTLIAREEVKRLLVEQALVAQQRFRVVCNILEYIDDIALPQQGTDALGRE